MMGVYLGFQPLHEFQLGQIAFIPKRVIRFNRMQIPAKVGFGMIYAVAGLAYKTFDMINGIKKTMLLVSTLLLLLQLDCFSQDVPQKIAKNSIYTEFFGSAVYLYNISYDRIVFAKEKNKVSLALGAQYLPSIDSPSDYRLSVSPQINYFRGIKHHFETGIGVAVDFNNGDFIIPIRIGYRFQKPEGGMFYKIGITPLYVNDFLGSPAVIPWGGLAIGWTL